MVKEILEIIISWPTVVIVVLIIFHKPILNFLNQFAESRRAKAKVGPSGLEIEMERMDEKDQKALSSFEVGKPVISEDTEEVLPETGDKKSLDNVYDLLIKEKNYREAQRVFYEEVKDQLAEDKQLLWEAIVLRHSNLMGDTDALRKLEEMAKQNPDEPEVTKQLALRYKGMGEFEEAEKRFLLAKDMYNAQGENQIDSVVYCYVQASQCLASDNKYDSAIDMLKQILGKQEFKGQYAKILSNMAYIAKDKELLEDFTFYAEASLNADPLDTDLRFNLAYTYSNMGREKMALLHYAKLINITPQYAIALNNLGVCYNHFKLKTKAITCYLTSAEHKETLAMGNLAHSYLEAGFVNEAKDTIRGANELSTKGIEVSARVGSAMQKLKNIQKEEDEEEKNLLKEAGEEKEFRLKYSQSRLSDKITSENAWEGPWETPWGETKIEIDKGSNSFQIKLYTKEEDLLASTLGRSFATSFIFSPPQKVYKERNIIIEGKISGITGRYTIKIDDAKEQPTFLTAGKIYNATGYMIINESRECIEIMEKTIDDKSDFKEWKKVKSNNSDQSPEDSKEKD